MSRLSYNILPLLFPLSFLVSCASVSRGPSQTDVVQEGIISIASSSGAVSQFSRKELSSRFPSASRVIHANPAYGGARKEYEGIDFKSLLTLIDPELIRSQKKFWFTVTTLDGWTAPPYESTTVLSGDALLALRENPSTQSEPISSDGLWSMVVTPKKQFYPGPFYLVWNDPGKNPDVLPLQVASIVLTRYKPEAKKKK